MSYTVIQDGSGHCFNAKVDSDLRLRTRSVQFTESQNAIILGNGYNLNSTQITLTTDGESALWYLKYNGDYSLVIKEILAIPGPSTGGSGSAILRIYRNPTTGTLITNQSPANSVNRNFSSTNNLSIDNYKGAEGNTVTDGDVFALTTRSDFTNLIALDAEYIVLEKSASIAATWQPPSSNTSQSVVIAATVFEYKGES